MGLRLHRGTCGGAWQNLYPPSPQPSKGKATGVGEPTREPLFVAKSYYTVTANEDAGAFHNVRCPLSVILVVARRSLTAIVAAEIEISALCFGHQVHARVAFHGGGQFDDAPGVRSRPAKGKAVSCGGLVANGFDRQLCPILDPPPGGGGVLWGHDGAVRDGCAGVVAGGAGAVVGEAGGV